ncbi:MAG: DmsE family decaheme c-type cytochrome [Candidatus Latescibacterota bacterium]
MPARRLRVGRGAVLVAALLAATQSDLQAESRVDWEALNPVFEGATFVPDQTCADCHEGSAAAYATTAHARAFGAGEAPAQGQCQVCHGPASKHIDSPGPDFAWQKLGAAQQSAVCMQCHEGGERMEWQGGVHLLSDVGCSSCHTVMTAQSEQGLLAQPRAQETCTPCHGGIRAQLWKSSHHPVREGRMDCASCHNPHGAGPALLRTATVNETCVTCHAEKRGPFVWEHAPVRESCGNCHEAHGSNNRSLLVRKDPFLCLQCHSYGGHVNLPRYNRVSTLSGSGCVNCHFATHGSNHPSGAKQTR